MKCPRREDPFRPAPNYPTEDEWIERDGAKRCSFCGSIDPDDFMARAEAGAELGPTDKNYKVYVAGSSFAKFYFQHLTEEQRRKFVDLVNAKTLNLGYPGHFYVPPFFMARR